MRLCDVISYFAFCHSTPLNYIYYGIIKTSKVHTLYHTKFTVNGYMYIYSYKVKLFDYIIKYVTKSEVIIFNNVYSSCVITITRKKSIIHMFYLFVNYEMSFSLPFHNFVKIWRLLTLYVYKCEEIYIHDTQIHE